MQDIRILGASEVNVNDYRKLRLEALLEEPQAFGSSHKDQINLPIEEWQKWLDNYIEGKNSWMVFAADGAELVGMIGAYQSEEIKNETAQIIAMYVSKVARGKGVSKLLIQRLLKDLSSNSEIKEVILDVNVDQVAAVNLYKSMRFNIVKNYNLQLGDAKKHEVYLMKRSL